MMKSLYLPVEIKSRELIPNLTLIREAINRGYVCYIGSKNSITRLLKNKKKKNGIFLSKSFLTKEETKEILTKCDSFCVLDHEFGFAMSESEIKKRINNLKKFILNKDINSIFLLNKKIYNLFVKLVPEVKKKIFITGWPRYDLKNEDYVKIYKKKIDEIKSRYENFFLFSSDFGILNKKDLKLLKQYYISYNWNKNNIKNEVKLNTKRLDGFKDFLKKICHYEKQKNYKNIIIRPHPNEDKREWLLLSKKFKKSKVIYKDAIEPWILSSNGLIHNGCSSAVEAMQFGKPSIYLKCGSYIRDTKIFKYSVKIFNLGDLNHLNKNKKKMKKNFFDDYLIKNSSANIISILNKSKTRIISHRDTINLKNKIIYSLKDFYYKYLQPNKSLIKNKLQDGLNKTEIEYILSIICPKKIYVSKVTDNCFLIKKNH